MRINHVRKRLEAGEASIGTWMSLPSPEAAEYVATLGFDWMVVDTEHNPVDIRTLSQMFGAISTTGVAPMVRIPWNQPENFKRVMDSGAWGIVVPMVNSKEEAERAIDATYFPPKGNRSIGGGFAPSRFHASGNEYYAAWEDQVVLALQIEHIDAVEHCDEILGQEGVHACFIGPNDLAASMGIALGVPLECEDPRMVEAIAHVEKTARECGVAPGIHCTDAAAVNMRLAQGFRFCAMASELKYMLTSLKEDLGNLNWHASPRTETGVTAASGAVRY